MKLKARGNPLTVDVAMPVQYGPTERADYIRIPQSFKHFFPTHKLNIQSPKQLFHLPNLIRPLEKRLRTLPTPAHTPETLVRAKEMLILTLEMFVDAMPKLAHALEICILNLEIRTLTLKIAILAPPERTDTLER
ncbi:MAG: hypothetical protein M3362_28040 [Acidobacteriota bacterium]|nr:hypothetical protein [Acidobacteriota bacterium]